MVGVGRRLGGSGFDFGVFDVGRFAFVVAFSW